MLISEKAVVSCYVDTAALMVMILLMLLSERVRRRRDQSSRIFNLLSWQILISCLFSFVYHSMFYRTEPLTRTISLISFSLWTCSLIMISVEWLAYVDAKLYGSRNYLNPQVMLRFVPLILCLLLVVINLFTGILFTVGEDNIMQSARLHNPMRLVLFLYFFNSALMVWRFDRKSEKASFLHIAPMLFSLLVAAIAHYMLSPRGVFVLGLCIGIILLYFSMADEFRFLDKESQLYNRRFLSYLIAESMRGKKIINSALVLEANGSLPGCFTVLRETLHHTDDVIRVKDRQFLLFTGAAGLPALQMKSTQVEEAVEKYNSEHPGDKIHLTVRSHTRAEDETADDFLRRVMEEKDSGDPIHGVVSMIAEIDRLDQELQLASDIQGSMLPTVFPPFPDRNEFDLYASMTPAKEVGGDFYDFFLIDDDHLWLVIADVSGKGVPAALFMMVSKTLIKNQLMGGCDPAAAMEHVNLQLCERNSASMFVTVWLAVVEISTGRGLACNAGHEKPGLRRSGGDFELLQYKHNPFAGVSKRARYQNREFELHPGDCLFVYTDGVPEANNSADEMFGDERLTVTLNQNPDASPEELIRGVRGAVDEFAGSAEQYDDITMLCMKYYGSRTE